MRGRVFGRRHRHSSRTNRRRRSGSPSRAQAAPRRGPREGDFEPWSALEPTLAPFLEEQVGRIFLPWSAANAEAIASGAEEFSVELDGKAWTQKPQKYHARSLAALKQKYAALEDRATIDAALEKTGCLEVLRG